jgi:hypothetical protein
MKQIFKFFTIFVIFLITLIACNLRPTASPETQLERAKTVDSFLNSIGVVVHLNYRDTAYNNFTDLIKPRLQELGVHHIRDGVKINDTETQEKFNNLGRQGIKSIFVMDPRDGINAAEAVTVAKSVQDSIEAVEGPNEWDLNSKYQYKEQSFPEGLRLFQTELYSAIKNNTATENLPILSPSMGRPHNAAKLGKVPCDIGNMHSYAGGHIPSIDLDEKWIPYAKKMCGDKPIIATECGYHNAINKPGSDSQPGVSEQAAARYLSRLYLEYFNRGIKRTYIHQLMNLKPNPEADKPNLNFGLLRSDGSRKPAFIAIRNMIDLLEEDIETSNSSASLNSLNYSLDGNINNVHHTLLQNKKGIFYLILWQEVPSFDLKNNIDLNVSSQEVTLTLNTDIVQANGYEPLNSIRPIFKSKNPQKLLLKVPDHPLIVELRPT